MRVLVLPLVLALAIAGCAADKPKPRMGTDGCGQDQQYDPDTKTCLGGFCGPGGSCDPMPPMPPTIPDATLQALPWFPSNGSSEMLTLEIPSFDAHQIPMTIYRPLVANATQQVPVLLHSHGFTGKRAATADAFKPLIAAGFGVVSFDERGHGDAKDDSEVYFMHPDHEVQDVIRVIDHVATFDWVLMEDPATASGPRDPVLGAFGGSYGGAYQLMGAIFDPRLDAIVPEITWNDMTEALAPDGAVKSGWIDLFYASGNAQQNVKFSNDFHAGFAYATASNEFPAGQLPGVPDLYTRLKESSPVDYPGGIRIPTLLIQGMPDTLFPLNQAVANLRALEAFDVESALYTHLGGHILATGGSVPVASPVPFGLQGQPGGKPCGALIDLQIAWHQTHLLGLGNWTGRPRVCIALEDETNVVGETFPLEGTIVREIGIAGPTPVAQAAAGPSVPLDLFTASEETVVAGIPTIKGIVTAAGADSIVFFCLKWADALGNEAIVDDQVTPMRLREPVTSPYAFSFDLGGVATRLQAGDKLVLVVSTVEPMFFGSAEREPGAVVLGDITVGLPTLPADTPTMPISA